MATPEIQISITPERVCIRSSVPAPPFPYEAELGEVKARGYDMPLARKLLVKFEGDVERVVKRLQRLREGHLPANLQGPAQKYAKEIRQVKARGIDMPVMTVRLLQKFNGDVEEACKHLKNAKAKLEGNAQKNQKVNVKIPPRFQGIAKRAIEFLSNSDGNLQCLLKGFANLKAQCQKHEAQRKAQKADAKKKARAAEAERKEKARAAEAERKESAVEKKTKVTPTPRSTVCAGKKIPAKLQPIALKYESEIQQVRSKGYDYPIMTIRLLNKFNGDVDATVKAIQRRTAKSEAASAKAERVKDRKARMVAPKFEEELKQVQDRGFDFPVLTARLLNRFNGDIDQVVAQLTKVKAKAERKRARKDIGAKSGTETAIATATATENATESATKSATESARLPPKLRTCAEKYDSEIRQIKEHGFNMPVRTIRLLQRFDGDVSKVIERLQKVQARLDMQAARAAKQKAHRAASDSTSAQQ